ncbi:hypothetical protein [Segatella copri]|uniref:hypothetical protein n=1 Tax=Segatella copri TaxID=165179 RepID=UPI002232A695|nr:hypothetical protein [Segatella copri]MCW4101563.1 hypothetical protein [Segatella copri]
MKERLKMIFDRIDIFVVCIVFGCCLTVAEVFIGTWGGFVLLFIMTSLITEVCYTLRCNEKLEIELIETKEKLKEAKGKVKELQNEVIAEQEKYNHWIGVNGKYFKIVQLCRDLWEERYCLEEAKVLLCKKKLTTGGFLEQIKTHEEAIADIENKIRQANIEYKKFRNQH